MQAEKWFRKLSDFANFKEICWEMDKHFKDGNIVLPGFLLDGFIGSSHAGMSKVMYSQMVFVFCSDETHEVFLQDFEYLESLCFGMVGEVEFVLAQTFAILSIKSAIKSVANGKTADKHGLSAEVPKALVDDDLANQQSYVQFFIRIAFALFAIAMGKIEADDWIGVAIVIVAELRSPKAPADIRLVTLGQIIKKLYRQLLLQAGQSQASPFQTFQSGGRAGTQPADATMSIRLLIDQQTFGDFPVHFLKVDMSAAFDSVRHSVLFQALLEFAM